MERKSEFWASQNVVITNCNQARDDERLGDVVIQSKEDYLRFLENDKKALYKKANHPLLTIYGNMKDFSEKPSIMLIAEEIW